MPSVSNELVIGIEGRSGKRVKGYPDERDRQAGIVIIIKIIVKSSQTKQEDGTLRKL